MQIGKIKVIVTLGLLFLAFSSLLKAEEVEIREVLVPYLKDANVELDGKLDEPCWQKAALANDFFNIFGKSELDKAKEQTEFRVFYDLKNLYLGVKCNESQMKKINIGLAPNPSGDTQMHWMGEVVEIFLNTNGVGYFHLGVMPSGARSDSFNSDFTWDGKWAVKTTMVDDHWALEAIIPFSSLAKEYKFAGTPAPGAIWRANVCRVASPGEEFSSWNKVAGGFHQPKRFGKFIFAGSKDKAIAVKDIAPGEFLIGKNSFKATIENPEKSEMEYEISLELREEEKKVLKKLGNRKVKLSPGEQTVIELPYFVKRGGAKELFLSARSNDKEVYFGKADFFVYPIFEKVKEMESGLKALAGEIGEIQGPIVEEKLKDIGLLKEKVRKLKSELSDKDNWKDKQEKAEKIAKEIDRLNLFVSNELKAYKWLKETGNPDAAFAVGTEYAGRKVFKNKPFRGDFSKTVQVGLARNEYESRQIVIFALKEGLNSVEISVTDLKNSQEVTLAKNEIELHRVGYVYVQEISPGPHGDYWPDMLYPLQPFDVKAGSLQPVMITVHVPENQQEGLYRGEIVVKVNEDESMKLDLEVQVHPFSIATTSHLKSSFWYHSSQVQAIYGDSGLERFTQFAEILGKYRIPPYPDFEPAREAIKIYREKNGKLTFDFSGLDPWMEVAIRNGMNTMNINFYPSGYQVWPDVFSGDLWGGMQVTDRATGKTKKLVADNPLETYYEFIGAAWKYCQKKGWADLMYYEGVDEPFLTDLREKLKEIYPEIAKVAPGLKRISAGALPRLNLTGYLEIWCPKVELFEPEDYSGRSEEKWWYHLGYKPAIFNYTTNAGGLEPRIAPWLCWKYGITGHLNWGSNYWLNGEAIKKIADTGIIPWANPQWVGCLPEYAAGEAVLVYPMPDGPIPSLRLVNIRDGFEDYEYLYLLNQLFDKAKSKGMILPQKLAKETRRLLAIPPEVAESTSKWTKSPEQMEKVRKQIATCIVLWHNELKGK